MLMILFSTVLWAECTISPALYRGDACPITSFHLQQLKNYYTCKNTFPTQFCLDKEYKGNSPYQNLSFFLPPKILDKITESEANELIAEFFKEHRDELTERIAKDLYQNEYQRTPASPPPWNRHMSETEMDGLTDKQRRRYSDLPYLQAEHMRLRIQSDTPAGAALLSRFEDRYKNYIEAAKSHQGSWSLIKEPRLQQGTIGGENFTIDLANTNWENIPNNFRYRDSSGTNVNFKEMYRNSTFNHFTALKNHFMNNGTINNLDTAFTGTPIDVSAIQGELREIGAHYLDNLSSGDTFAQAKHMISTQAKRRRSAHRPGRLRLGALSLNVASLAVSVAMIQVENQMNCKNAFPFYPTSYQEKNMPGFTDAINCQMVMPDPEKQPREVLSFLSLSATDQEFLLSQSSSGHSPCEYYRQAYNHIFCNQLTTTGENGEEPSSN